jgi:hypothetical protein
MRNYVTKPAVALATAMGWLAFNAVCAKPDLLLRSGSTTLN